MASAIILLPTMIDYIIVNNDNVISYFLFIIIILIVVIGTIGIMVPIFRFMAYFGD